MRASGVALGASIGIASIGTARVGARRHRPRWLLAALLASTVGMLAIPARSADLPFLQPPASSSFYRWDGAYLGVNVGYAFGASDYGIAGFPPQTFAGLTPTSASA